MRMNWMSKQNNIKNLLQGLSFVSELQSSGLHSVRLEARGMRASPGVRYEGVSSASLIQLSCFSRFSCAYVHIP